MKLITRPLLLAASWLLLAQPGAAGPPDPSRSAIEGPFLLANARGNPVVAVGGIPVG